MPDPEESHLGKLGERLVAQFRGLPQDGPSRSFRRPTKALADLIEKICATHHLGRPSIDQLIREKWVEIVGTANAEHSHPARVERNRLVVLAPHSVVRHEIFLHRETILARVRALPGCGEIRSLNVRPG